MRFLVQLETVVVQGQGGMRTELEDCRMTDLGLIVVARFGRSSGPVLSEDQASCSWIYLVRMTSRCGWTKMQTGSGQSFVGLS